MKMRAVTTGVRVERVEEARIERRSGLGHRVGRTGRLADVAVRLLHRTGEHDPPAAARGGGARRRQQPDRALEVGLEGRQHELELAFAGDQAGQVEDDLGRGAGEDALRSRRRAARSACHQRRSGESPVCGRRETASTRQPAASRARTRWPPRKPEAPVTRTGTGRKSRKSYGKAAPRNRCDTLPSCMRVGALVGRGRRLLERLSRRIRRVESRVVSMCHRPRPASRSAVRCSPTSSTRISSRRDALSRIRTPTSGSRARWADPQRTRIRARRRALDQPELHSGRPTTSSWTCA